MANESVGDILRAERLRRRLTLVQAGELVGYSSSALSRIELGGRLDIDSLRGLAQRYGIPPHRLGLATLGDQHTIDGSGEDDVQRRQFLITAAGVAVPHRLLARLDDALVSLPQAPGPVTATTVTALLAGSRALFDAASYTALVAGLPDLLAAAHEHADATPDDPAALARVAASYELATHTLDKIGRHQASRITADRAMAHARRADSPLAMALSSRALSVVLRHEGRPLIAQRVNLDAIGAVEATGLVTTEQRTVLTQMLCSAAYSAGQGNDRDRALELITDAHRAVRGLPDRARTRATPPRSPQPRFSCTRSGCTGRWATPLAPWTPHGVCDPRSSPRPNAADDSTQTSPARGGNTTDRSRPSPPCSLPTGKHLPK